MSKFLREDIRLLIQDQYEIGWKTVLDIDILTDKILTVVNQRLDLDLDILYNENIKDKNYETYSN